MAIFLRQSTAVDVAIGPFLDDADGKTIEDSLTISQADVRLKKNNGSWAQVNDNTAATHEENGWYEKELDATDTNTVGRLLLAVHEGGALPVWHEFYVLEEAVFDALFAASSAGYASQASVDDLPTNAELTTALASADDAVLAQVALVKAKTDSLTFTQSGHVDANIQRVNDVALQGDGSSTPWGP